MKKCLSNLLHPLHSTYYPRSCASRFIHLAVPKGKYLHAIHEHRLRTFPHPAASSQLFRTTKIRCDMTK